MDAKRTLPWRLILIFPAMIAFNAFGFSRFAYDFQFDPSTNHDCVQPSAATSSSKPRQDDWFNATEWNTTGDLAKFCPYVENVCFQNQQWFYDIMPQEQQQQEGQHIGQLGSGQLGSGRRRSTIVDPFQPDYKIVFNDNLGMPRNKKPNAYRLEVQIERSIPIDPRTNVTVEEATKNCRYSQAPNHMVLQGQYTNMLGEFYSRIFFPFIRVVAKLKQTMLENGNGSNDDKTVATAATQQMLDDFDQQFSQQTQIYLSNPLGQPQQTLDLLDSHRLFMEPFSANPPLSLRALFDNTQCNCAQRLFLCGYTSKNPTPNILQETGSIVSPQFLGKRRNVALSMEDARDFLRARFITQNPLALTEIRKRRLELLSIAGVDFNEQTNADAEWKIIGLAQRTTRRVWTDLQRSLRACNSRLKASKICCVTINIEDDTMSSPVKHMTTHGALDGLIGIHGAQLTEALFMPPGSLVVELLPWVLEGLNQGRWTVWAHEPTPLGVIYSETDLNHIGYPLNQSSAQQVPCRRGQSIVDCFRPMPYRWDTRSFTVHPEIILDVLDKFVAAAPKTCEEFQHNSGDDYVLYNVNCLDADNSSEPSIHHFYRPGDWVDTKTQSGKQFHVKA